MGAVDAGSLERAIRDGLARVKDPCSLASVFPMNLDEMGLLEDIEIGQDGDVVVRLRLTSPSCLMIGFLATEIERFVAPVEGVRTVTVTHDTGMTWDPSMIRADVRERRRLALLDRYGG
ncbi:metal-sulfur cluster assembly factor [Acrocarpospora catenulata]|uniref:metal-sulfur cluster assembly factor n=1 Tax=Acrocarpospora catenulata TaxID=2836182 RepID=UPI001BDB4DC7|nr:iron-sulfur cluster assembly protein [Acrocarpospora catenulata]